MDHQILTERLVLRPWRADDAAGAWEIYGDHEIARWLSPALGRVLDVDAMRVVLQEWEAESLRTAPPGGRWAMEDRSDGTLVGGVILLPLPPGGLDLELGWQVRRDVWGRGYAGEAGRAMARHAFAGGVDEVFSVVRPANTRAAAVARRLGMEWVGETEKYYDLHLQVYRLRPGDLTP